MTSPDDDTTLQPYQNQEPEVVDDELLSATLFEHGPQEFAGKLAQEEGIDFFKVRYLQLDFRSKLYHLLYCLSQCSVTTRWHI